MNYPLLNYSSVTRAMLAELQILLGTGGSNQLLPSPPRSPVPAPVVVLGKPAAPAPALPPLEAFIVDQHGVKAEAVYDSVAETLAVQILKKPLFVTMDHIDNGIKEVLAAAAIVPAAAAAVDAPPPVYPVKYVKAAFPDLTVTNDQQRQDAIAKGYVPAVVEAPVK